MANTPYSKCEPLITSAQIKSRYLFGIDLTDMAGNELPEETIQYSIDTAVSFLEHALDIVILPRTITGERHDYRGIDYNNFNFMNLKQRPVIDVDLVTAMFPNNQNLVEYPKEWYVVEKESAQLQMTPGVGAYTSKLLTPAGGNLLPFLQGTRDQWPHLFSVDYRAGFCDDAIPNIINEMIGLQASIGIFDLLGDIILGLGTPSESVSIDGASVSKQLTSSAGMTVFSSRTKSYQAKLDKYVEVIRKYYNGIPFTVV